MSPPNSENQRIGAAEVRGVALLTLAALTLRLAHLGQFTPSHFDEGVYLLWGLAGGYPGKEFFAPPLFPGLIRAAAVVAGPTEAVAQLISVLFGAATVPAVWWLVRRWYSAHAAIASAAMVVFSGFHITFSRLALTDVVFTFWFVLALAVITEAVFRNGAAPDSTPLAKASPTLTTGWRWSVLALAALAAGAAMNTKYNGPLVLMIPAIAVVTHEALRVLGWSQLNTAAWRTLPRFALIAGIAILLYLPWLYHVQTTYGYVTLLQHHKGYSTGIRQWPQNFATLLAFERFLNRNMGFIGPLVGMAFALASLRTAPNLRALAVLICASVAGYFLGDGVGWMLAPIGLVVMLRLNNPMNLVLLTWLVGLVLLTPLYRPYARLMLPLLAGGWVAYGVVVDQVLSRLSAQQATGAIRFRWAGAWLACLAGVGLIYWHQAHLLGMPSHGAVPLSAACEQLVASVPQSERVSSYCRPPALYFMAKFAGTRVSGLRDPSAANDFQRWLMERAEPRFLVVDLSLLPDNPSLRKQLDGAKEQLEEIGRFAYRPNDAVLLDDFGSSRLAPNPDPDLQSLIGQTYQLVLYKKR